MGTVSDDLLYFKDNNIEKFLDHLFTKKSQSDFPLIFICTFKTETSTIDFIETVFEYSSKYDTVGFPLKIDDDKYKLLLIADLTTDGGSYLDAVLTKNNLKVYLRKETNLQPTINFLSKLRSDYPYKIVIPKSDFN